MKIIKIKSCWDCPYCQLFPGLEGFRCIKKGRERVYQFSLPDWCLLEEVHGANNWINIKDQLPPQDERVLVWLWEKDEIDIDILRREGKSDGGGFQFIRNYLHNITFWMPLPSSPGI